MKQFKVIRCHR